MKNIGKILNATGSSTASKYIGLSLLIPLGAWIYSRVHSVNPAILADEYLYSINARKALPWDASPAGDFSNYLFNFVYQSTNLCGSNFYLCGKALNIIFFLSFIFILFTIATRYLPVWVSLLFMSLAAISPLSVYTSMFLPESMYMFFIGVILMAVLRALNSFTWQNWVIVGVAIGLTSLVKPHAWLSAIPIFITLLVVGLGDKSLRWRRTTLSALALAGGAVLGRVLLGFLIAGPKALGFFGKYFSLGAAQEITRSVFDNSEGEMISPEGSALTGVSSLFASQLTIHVLVVAAFLSLALAPIIGSILEIVKTRKLISANAFSLFAFIWLAAMVIQIVIFTGWITGSGDDHSTRVLLRYYEFLFVIVPLAALVAVFNGIGLRLKAWTRWLISVALIALLNPAFTGAFSTLTIQIADAPTLAGLVVNAELFNLIAIFGFGSLVLFATFPKYFAIALISILPLTMAGAGFQAQGQYILFRGESNPQDLAGKYIRDNFDQSELDSFWILANSRFEATNVAIWADSPNITYEMLQPGTEVFPDQIPGDKNYVLLTGDLSFSDQSTLVYDGEGFKIFKIR